MIALADSAAHVFLDDLSAPVLDSTDEHHLARVLRLRDGERVSASDGRGSWAWYRWSSGALVPDSGISIEPRRRSTGIAVSLIKGDRLDWVVQKATEIGIDRLIPMAAERSVVRWDGDKAAAQQQRLQRIAREAAMQSRRVWLPTVEPVVAAHAVLGVSGVLRADLGGGRRLEDVVESDPALPVVVAVGPEGGWGDPERQAGAPSVSLGDNVLRTETAALVAAVLLSRDAVH